MKKICVITGSRAEYGLMSHLMRLISDDDDLKLQIIATNMHLSPKFEKKRKKNCTIKKGSYLCAMEKMRILYSANVLSYRRM